MPKKPIKPAAPVRMTKRQISRHQREQRQVRLVIAGVAAILALIILIPAFGLWREVLAKGDQPLAVVAGESISISTYAKVLGFRQYVIQQQVAQLRSEAAALITPTPTAVPGAQPTPTPAPSTPAPGSPTPLPTPSDPRLADLDRQFQQLTRDNAVLEDTVQKDLINDVFIRQELAQRGVTVSSSEVDQAILSDRSLGNTKAVIAAQPTTEGGSSTEPNPTSVVQLPGPTLDSVRELVASSGYLSWDEFRRFVAEPRARKAKLQSILAEAVPSQAEQVHARHIVLKTEEDANKALARLQQQVAQLRSEAAALITPTPTAVPGAQPTPTPAPSTPAPGSPT
ncbi:MAG: hypothetical protein M1531_09965, partial [Chloroflexi bacterium]|nr:hypothetical protein [Chloroflexota bacterium]